MKIITPPPKERSRNRGKFLDYVWDAQTARVLSTVLIFAAVILFVRAAHDTFILFLFAILFAYFLAPVVAKLEGPLRGRGNAILVVYLVLAGVLAAIGFVAGPSIAGEARSLVKTLPSLLERLSSGDLIAEFGQHHHWDRARVQQIQQF